MQKEEGSPDALDPAQVVLFSDESALPAPPSSTGNLRKPVETIVLQPRTGKLTLLDRRFFNVLLRHAQENPVPEGPYYRISLAQFMADAKYESRNMEHLADVLNHMMGTVVNWGNSVKNLKGPKYQWQGAPLITFARIRKDSGRAAVLEYEFQRELLPQLLNPSVYATISLELIAKMNTHPSTVLLEIAVRYLSSPHGLSQRLPWRDWVPILTGNASTTKTEFKYFARDVLKSAISHVNAAQELFTVKAHVTKVNRRVDTLQFEVVRNKAAPGTPDASSRLAEVGVENLQLVGRLRNLAIPQATAESLIVQYGASRMSAALAELEPRVEAGTVKKTLAYLKTLLEKGDLQESPDYVQDVAAVEVPNIPVPDNTRRALLQAYCDAAMREAMALFEEQPAADQAGELDSFEAEHLPNLAEPLQRAWRTYRPQWPAKPMTAFLRPVFGRWLARTSLTPSDEDILNWAVRSGKLNLQA
jgi:hypothetical protein